MNESLVRHVLFPLHERLKRKPTFRWLAELEHTQWLSPERLAEYQFVRLRRLVEFAYAHVPYYRAILDEPGVPPQRLQSPYDLRDFPFLTRELIRPDSMTSARGPACPTSTGDRPEAPPDHP